MELLKEKTETSCGMERNALLHPYFTLMFNLMVADFEAVLLVVIIIIIVI